MSFRLGRARYGPGPGQLHRVPLHLARFSSAIVIGMNPGIGSNAALLGQPDHSYRGRGARRPARAAFQRRFELPDRRIARPSDRIERQTGAGFATAAHHFEPTIASVKTLRDGRRGLRRTAKSLHLFGPQQAFSGVRRADGQFGMRTRILRADPRRADAITKNPLSAAASHRGIIARLRPTAILQALAVWRRHPPQPLRP